MLFGSLSVSATGVLASSQNLDVIGNNVANLNTTGFNPSVVDFQDLIYIGPPPGGASAQGLQYPEGEQLGAGVDLAAITPVFTQGQFISTGRQYDLAISGLGFFAVTLPDGSTGYTRAGNFTVDSSGQLVTDEGFLVAPAIVIPPGTGSVQVGLDGTVIAVSIAGQQVVGQVTLTTFPNPGGLLQNGDTIFLEGPASGAPTSGTPGTQGLGTIAQGSLEQSTVDISRELVNLVIAQQAFRFNTQAITVENAVLGATVDLIA